jgi:hypothetical protein
MILSLRPDRLIADLELCLDHIADLYARRRSASPAAVLAQDSRLVAGFRWHLQARPRRADTRGQPLPALAGGLADTPQRARILGLIEPAAIKKDGTAAERQRRYRQRRKA